MAEMDCRGWRNRTRDGTIKMPGREFRKFQTAGGGKLVLDQLNQSSAKIEISGAGSVKANGRVDDLKTEIEGSGDADFGQVTTHRAAGSPSKAQAPSGPKVPPTISKCISPAPAVSILTR